MAKNEAAPNAAAEDTGGRGLVKSAERAVMIMEVLADSTERLTLGQLQERTGYPRSSLHALLRTLTALKWIESADGETAFGIGPHALLCGTAYLDRDPALPFAVRQLELLRADVGFTTHYARLDGANVIYLATREATDSRRLTSRVGRQLPAYATALGKALLAELTPRETDRLLPADGMEALTEHTVTSRPGLHAELEQARGRGWALEWEQNTPGLCCVAAPVTYRIPATDAISCSMPRGQVAEKEVGRIAETVRRHSDELARTLRREGIR
ncbi:MAG TPA: IclR family transcriptional regulator [Streptomyces sp.]|nr:IclR family transcriptional regulator [Streptomyces sp.]